MHHHFKTIRKILIGILILNWAVAAVKLVIGSLTGSASVMADGFNALSDGSTNVIGLIGVALAAKPSDEDHPYGHHKFETLTTLGVVVLLGVVSVQITLSAFAKFLNPVLPQVSPLDLFFLVLTLFINLWVVWYERRKGHQLRSSLLIADALHTQSAVYVSIGVLLTLGWVMLDWPLALYIDPLMSLVVVGFILKEAWSIFKENSGMLLDEAQADPCVIQRLVMDDVRVKGVHQIRSRGTLSVLDIDMHILVDPSMRVEDAHTLTHDLEAVLNGHFDQDVRAIIHTEPYSDARFERHASEMIKHGFTRHID
jgi:cation diffusion facilitator family transporter